MIKCIPSLWSENTTILIVSAAHTEMIKFLSADLHSKTIPGRHSRSGMAFGILAVLVVLIYSNSFQASWHFDDYENVVSNPRVQIKDLQPSTIYLTFFASPEGKRKPFRSLAYLSFALNAYFGGKDVSGYHAVNIAVHVATAFLLFLTVMKLFETPKLVGRSNNNAFFIALLTAALWAVNPIQTQAVTYIVQRMTSMAAMFYILGLYCYIVARLSPAPKIRISLIIGCGCCYFLAIMCKENAALLPLSLLLVEFIFFRDCRDPREIRLLILLLAAGAVAVIALGAVAFGNPFGFLNGYPNRTFTPLQRLLTETRVLVHYLSQIFYPVPTRLSVYHDVAVSKSLLHPWTTLPSLLIILLLIGLGLKWMTTRPLLSFAVLFFFVNHLIESTVIGLELVFEHRNYLPSLFIFMPVAAGVDRLVRHYGSSNILMQRILVSGVVLLIVGFGTGTFIRNQAWANEKMLWEDTLEKAPNSIRAHHELAYQYFEKNGNYEAALFLYHRGLNLSGQNVYEKTLSLNNIASIHFTRGEYVKAEGYWKEAIASYPKYKQAYYRLALTQTRMGEWNKAAETLAAIIDREPFDPNCLRLNGIILLRESKPEVAIGYFRKCIKVNPQDWQSLMYLGVAFSMTGHAERAYLFFRMAEAVRPKEPIIQLLLAKNRFIFADDAAVQSQLDEFIARVGPRHVENYLNRVSRHYESINFSLAALRPLIAKRIGYISGYREPVSKHLQDLPIDLTESSELKGSRTTNDTDGS